MDKVVVGDGAIGFLKIGNSAKIDPPGFLSVKPCFHSDIYELELL
jgi:hypothetical protein